MNDEGGEMWLDSDDVVKMKLTGLADYLDVVCERKRDSTCI